MAFYMSTEGGDDLSKLRVENRNLAEELAQCQADKEFVWSLWKRLQVASPDITQAIGLVIQREKEKQELKDRKVLEILQVKDDKIDELQKALSLHGSEVNGAISKKIELQDQMTRLQRENTELKEKIEAQEHKMLAYEGVSLDKACLKTEIHKEYEREREEMKLSISRLELDVKHLSQDKKDLSVIRDTQRERIQNLDDDLKAVSSSYEKNQEEHLEAKSLLKKYEKELSSLRRENRAKSEELESVRKELSELWETHHQVNEHASQQADLIKQLQSLQKDTQKMIKNQEDAFSLENSSVHALYNELSGKYQTLKMRERSLQHQLGDSNTTIEDLQQKLEDVVNCSKDRASQATLDFEDKETQSQDGDAEMEYKMQTMESELRSLKEKLRDKNKIVLEYEKSKIKNPPTKLKKKRSSSSPFRAPVSPRKASPVRSSSPQREGDNRNLQRKLENTERKLEDTRELLKMKMTELDEVKKAHNRRLERLQSLQKSHRLVREQLKTTEEELKGKPEKKKKLQRSDPKLLRKEDGDAAWNELAYYKTEFKNLSVEHMNVCEELDTHKVRAAEDAVTIHELNTCLEQEREELQFLAEQGGARPKSSTPQPDKQVFEDMMLAKSQLEKFSSQLSELQKEHFALKNNRDVIVEEKKALKGEVNQLKQSIVDKRMDCTNLRQELHRLKMDSKIKERKRKEKAKKTAVARQYQRALNKSIKEMSQFFDGFEKQGYSEVSEISTGGETTGMHTTDFTGTTDSLGQKIVQSAQVSRSMLHDISDTEISESETADTTLTQDEPNTPTLRPVKNGILSYPSIEKQVKRRNTGTSPIKVHPRPKTSTRTTSTSPVQFLTSSSRSHVVSKKANVGAPTSARQNSNLKQRVNSLQQQVTLLKTAKESISQSSVEQKRMCTQLQEDLSTANQRMKSARMTIQRLTGELERVKREKELVEKQFREQTMDTASSVHSHSEAEWNSIQSRLKNSSAELSKQLPQIKQLKADKAELEERVQDLQDRVGHLERDVSQKRVLLEDMKLRLKIAQENAESDADVMLQAESKLQSMTDVGSRSKVQFDSLKTRLSVVTKEKYENEEKAVRLAQELDKKSKAIKDLNRQCRELKSMLAEIETTAQAQLHAMASQSESVIKAAQTKANQSDAKLSEFDKFIKILVHALLNSVQQARSLMHQQSKKKMSSKSRSSMSSYEHGSSFKQAEKKVCDILNINADDLEDLMSARESDDESDKEKFLERAIQSEEAKQDKKWSKKCDKLIESKKPWAMPLVENIMSKVEERCRLSAKLSAS